MKKILTLSIFILVSVLFQALPFLPWWAFVVPVFALGLALPFGKWKVNAFLCGLGAGFLTWSLCNLLFELSYGGNITQALGKMLSVPYYTVYLIAGLIGGILTGLAAYSGFLLRRGSEELQLEIPKAG